MDSKTKFLIYCMEIYKRSENLTGAQVLERFSRYRLFDYVLEFYEILHIHGVSYILQDINSYIFEQSKSQPDELIKARGTGEKFEIMMERKGV